MTTQADIARAHGLCPKRLSEIKSRYGLGLDDALEIATHRAKSVPFKTQCKQAGVSYERAGYYLRRYRLTRAEAIERARESMQPRAYLKERCMRAKVSYPAGLRLRRKGLSDDEIIAELKNPTHLSKSIAQRSREEGIRQNTVYATMHNKCMTSEEAIAHIKAYRAGRL
jgi:lambda repressor-like predicted transcriptional regulator